MKTIIAGSREGAIARYVEEGAKALLQATKRSISEVVCGGAKGADELGSQWAKAKGIPVKRFPANWYPKGEGTKIDRGAGHKRNRAMADYGEALIAIWDGKSPGTKGMIEAATRLGLPIVVVDYRAGLLEIRYINV